MKIISATPEHADFIATCIMQAVGEEICSNFAGENHTLDDVHRLFATLAARPDTQYSYRNTEVAVDEDGRPMGACVAYDGANLHAMREHFFTAARDILGIEMGKMEDECDADEFYIDTLAVAPEFRRQGVALALLEAAKKRAVACGKPAGLLVEKENHRARRLYNRAGFTRIGDRPFAFIMMDHLQT